MATPRLALPRLPASALEHLLDRTSLWVYTVDAREQVLSINRTMANRIDFDLEQLQDARALTRLLYPEPEFRDTVQAQHRAVLAGESAPEAEWVVSLRSGEQRIVRWQMALVGAATAADRVLVVMGDDVTERRQLDQWTRLQNALLDRVPDAVVVADLEGRIIHWTGAAQALLGYPARSALERPLSNLLTDENPRERVQEWIQTLRSQGHAVFEQRMRREDGETAVFRVEGTRVANERGQAVGIALVCAPGGAGAEPRRTPLDRVFAQVGNVAAVLTDAAGVVTGWNRAAERLGGLGSTRALGRTLFDEVMFTPDTPWAGVRDRLLARGRHQAQVRVARPNGTEAIADLDAVALTEGAQVTGAVFFYVDRSEAQALMAEALRSKTRAAHALLSEGLARRVLDAGSWLAPDHRAVLTQVQDLRALGRLVASGATLREFDIAARRVRHDALGERFDDLLYRLGEGVQRLSGLADDVAVVERTEADAPGALRIGRELEAARELLAHHFDADVALELEVDDLPAVNAARAPMLRGLALLLAAAVESCREAHDPRVVVEGRVQAGWLHLELRDTGAGYAVGVQSHLNDTAWLAQQPGLAPLLLGLARESLRLAGGNLELETAPGAGARVRVHFPLADAGVSIQAAEVPTRAGHLRGHVLLIEEDDLLRRALQRTLGEEHAVHAFASFPEALAHLADARFDAAVVSFPRPESAGLRFLERLAAAAPALHRNAIVVVPPDIRHATRERLVSQGSVVVARPVDFTLLRSVLLRMMPIEELGLDEIVQIEPDA